MIIFLKSYFFVNSIVDFANTVITDEQWKILRSDPENTHWHAPYPSTSEYLLVKDDRWLLYRRADHWGKISNGCNWTLDGEEYHQDDDFSIGFADLINFKFYKS